MTAPDIRLRDDFDRIATLSQGHRDADRYQSWLLQQVPRPCRSALDIGCGTGSLARALAGRSERVTACDLSPKMIAVARQHSREAHVEFLVGDFLSLDLPEGYFDCIAAVASLHHMPWVEAVERAKRLLRAGGMLLIVDLVRDEGLHDRAVSGVACVLRALGNRQPRELREAWADHGRQDTYLTLSEAQRLCDEHLSGARVRRHLYWRYSVTWRKGGDA